MKHPQKSKSNPSGGSPIFALIRCHRPASAFWEYSWPVIRFHSAAMSFQDSPAFLSWKRSLSSAVVEGQSGGIGWVLRLDWGVVVVVVVLGVGLVLVFVSSGVGLVVVAVSVVAFASVFVFVAAAGLRGVLRCFLLGVLDSMASVWFRERLTGVVSVVGVGLGGVDAVTVFWGLGVLGVAFCAGFAALAVIAGEWRKDCCGRCRCISTETLSCARVGSFGGWLMTIADADPLLAGAGVAIVKGCWAMDGVWGWCCGGGGGASSSSSISLSSSSRLMGLRCSFSSSVRGRRWTRPGRGIVWFEEDVLTMGEGVG